MHTFVTDHINVGSMLRHKRTALLTHVSQQTIKVSLQLSLLYFVTEHSPGLALI